MTRLELELFELKERAFNGYNLNINVKGVQAVVVAELTEQTLLALEDPESNPVISNFCRILFSVNCTKKIFLL